MTTRRALTRATARAACGARPRAPRGAGGAGAVPQGLQAQAAAARKRNAVSYRLSPWGINLPSALCLEQAQVARVAEVFWRILGKA